MYSQGAAASGHGSHRILSKVVAWFFVSSGVFCLLFETAGSALYAGPTYVTLARLLLLTGLGAQLAFLTGFIVLVAVMQTSKLFGFAGDKRFRPVFICIYATTALLNVRNGYRIIAEFSSSSGAVAHQEHNLYAFDFLPIYICFLLLTCLHYGFWIGPTAPLAVARQRADTPVVATDKQRCDVAGKLNISHSLPEEAAESCEHQGSPC